jgi:glycosyltransferase involved in cell wall biosynthesis
MKILILSGLYPNRDNPMAGVFITRRMKKLKQFGISFKIYSFHIHETLSYRIYKRIINIPQNSRDKSLEVDGIEYNFLTVQNTLLDRRFQGKKAIDSMTTAVLNELKKDHYDLIQADWVYPEGYIATLVKNIIGIPCIISALGDDIRINPIKYKKRKTFTNYALENANRVFFTDGNMLLFAKQFGYLGNNAVILPPVGVDMNLFSPQDTEKCRNSLNISPKPRIIVGFVGSLVWVKRADKLIDIFGKVGEKDSTIQFVVIGDGPYRNELEKQNLNEKNNALFLGYVNPEIIPTYLNAFDLLILPSRSEGLPNVILEAQSCGCPVIGSNVGGIPEAIGHGGMIVDEGPEFEIRFADAIINMVRKPKESTKIRESVSKYHIDTIAKKQVDLYYEIIKEK